MGPIYLGLAIVIFLIFAGFGILSWVQNHARQQALTFDMGTPTPAPALTATPKPTQLRDGQSVGTAIGFPRADLRHGISADLTSGGHGSPVDGIPCQAEMVQVHVHSHLALFINGREVQIPGAIGLTPTPQGGCFYWLHTHGPDGIIHVEAGAPDAPQGGHYNLGMFFDIWGTSLSARQVGPFIGKVTAFVNGAHYDGDPRTIPLRSHQDITLEVGQPVVTPPAYRLPPYD